MSLRLEIEEIEEKFREMAMKKYGYSKGALKKASIEALSKWIAEQKEIPSLDNSFSLIEGILERFRGKVNSVELQHSVLKMWVK